MTRRSPSLTIAVAVAALGAVLLLVMASACATTPDPGDPDYPYNLEGAFPGTIFLGDSIYPVVAEIRTLGDGTVRGSLRPADEASLSGDLSGTIRADSVVWRSSWTLGRSGCSGVLLGWGRVLPAEAGAEGLLRSEGSCPASQGSGSFRFLR